MTFFISRPSPEASEGIGNFPLAEGRQKEDSRQEGQDRTGKKSDKSNAGFRQRAQTILQGPKGDDDPYPEPNDAGKLILISHPCIQYGMQSNAEKADGNQTQNNFYRKSGESAGLRVLSVALYS